MLTVLKQYAELDALFAALPALALKGPKGVGKTATAARRAAASVPLDDEAQRAIIDADPTLLLQRPRPVLIDEWQHVPAVWDVVRRAVDRDASPLSSSSPDRQAPSGPARTPAPPAS